MQTEDPSTQVRLLPVVAEILKFTTAERQQVEASLSKRIPRPGPPGARGGLLGVAGWALSSLVVGAAAGGAEGASTAASPRAGDASARMELDSGGAEGPAAPPLRGAAPQEGEEATHRRASM